MKKIVIYPGRFQPMLPHHAEVYNRLQAKFPDADVYIASSNKVDGAKSPFNFQEKSTIMTTAHGIPANKIILAANPYLVDSYKAQFDQQNTMVIFAVGGKDDQRFPMNNIDDSTGLDMTVRGEPRPKYYQMINTLKQHPPLPMGERGYIYITPTIAGRGDRGIDNLVASASAFRNAFISAPDEGSRKEIFTRYMGEYNNNIYALFVNKLMDNKMKTENAYQIDVVKYLSGLLSEAPINFDDMESEPEAEVDSDDYRPGFKQDNMINQLGKVIDSDDASKEVDAMKVKKFSPKTSVQTDDGDTVDVSAGEAKALKKMMDMLSSARMGEERSARERFLGTIQKTVGLQSMLDFAKSKGLVEEETSTLPQVDLGNIRDDYAVEEGGDEWFANIDGPQDWMTAFAQCKPGSEECDTLLTHEVFSNMLSDGPLDDFDDLYQAYDVGKADENMIRKYQELAKSYLQSDSESLEEGKMKDVIQDAMDMSREEFNVRYDNAWDYDEIHRDYGEDAQTESAVEEGKLPAGLQAYQDKKNGKKDDDADKDEVDEDEDKEEEVDENAQFESSLAQLKKLSGI